MSNPPKMARPAAMPIAAPVRESMAKIVTRSLRLFPSMRPDRAHAEWALWVLTGRVRAARGTGNDDPGIDRQDRPFDFEGEAVEPARCGTELVLAGVVVLRSV